MGPNRGFACTLRVVVSIGGTLAFVVASLGMRDTAYADDARTCAWWLERVGREPTDFQTLLDAEPETGGAESENLSPIVIDFVDPWHVASMTEAEKIAAIECLLGAENDLRPGAFSGAARFETSTLFAPATANLSALYFISYIYNGRYDHAGGVGLRGDDAEDTESDSFGYATNASAIHRAYDAYRTWFAEVREIGLENAHQADIQPLDDSGLSWW